jgi:hypothetical protein
MSSWGTTLRVPAVVHLADGTELDGAVHVQPAVAHHTGPETVLELLNRPEPFLVVALGEEGVRFVPKAQVALVETALPDDGGDEAAAGRRSAVKHLPLEIEMTSDRVLSGLAECELPPTRSRTLDFLNDSGAFLALAAEATLWAVHRAHIRTVRPMD